MRQKRVRAGIGDDVRYREKWRLALNMLDRMIEQWGPAKPPAVSDCGYGDCSDRGLVALVVARVMRLRRAPPQRQGQARVRGAWSAARGSVVPPRRTGA
ncbi:transposase [Dactylosporangium darangshiense]|uniref:transposase n=1 Tax=Dactylosporangium darangshiense TaxID=579108 RepID=UPI003635A999